MAAAHPARAVRGALPGREARRAGAQPASREDAVRYRNMGAPFSSQGRLINRGDVFEPTEQELRQRRLKLRPVEDEAPQALPPRRREMVTMVPPPAPPLTLVAEHGVGDPRW